MLTGYQCATGAYSTEDGELICPQCFDDGETFARPVSNYELDEYATAVSGEIDWDDAEYVVTDDAGTHGLIRGVWHLEDCACTYALEDEAGHELVEAYEDFGCVEAETEKSADLERLAAALTEGIS